MTMFRFRGMATVATATLLSLGLGACVKDLDREPFYDLNTESVYTSPENQRGALAKLYAGLVTTGQSTTNRPDVQGADEGATSYSRLLWKLQELPADHAAVAWTDGAIQDLNRTGWTVSNDFSQFMYNRIYFQVALCNDFIRQMSDAKLSERGISGTDLENARRYREEARFLRALSYYHAIDFFGTGPFVTENDPIGKFLPPQATRQQLFDYVESELQQLETSLPTRGQAEYGRATQAAAQTLLARLYLNAEVYTGRARYDKVVEYCTKVITAGYTLAPTYANLFLADNNVTSASEIIFPIICDGTRTQSFGGTTFLVHASAGGSVPVASLGITNPWSGIRAKKNLPLAFGLSTPAEAANPADKRAMFFTTRQNLEMASLGVFRDGWAVQKWKNVTSTGQAGSDATGTHVDTDIPLMRLADVYLMYAEAVVRGGGGSRATALGYVNALRRRAYGNNSGDITDAQLTADFVLDERARELYWEGYRRTDLIRYGRFAGPQVTYNWPWKGGVLNGQPVAARFNVYPIPLADITANPNLKQLFPEY